MKKIVQNQTVPHHDIGPDYTRPAGQMKTGLLLTNPAKPISSTDKTKCGSSVPKHAKKKP